jgi:hypothetical protein
MKKYLVVEKSCEYNDEYNIIGDGYTVKSKLYNSKEQAKELGKRQAIIDLFKDYRFKFDSSDFDFQAYSYEDDCKKLKKFMDEKGWKYDNEDYQLTLPKGLSEDDVVEAYSKWDLDLFDIIEVDEMK